MLPDIKSFRGIEEKHATKKTADSAGCWLEFGRAGSEDGSRDWKSCCLLALLLRES